MLRECEIMFNNSLESKDFRQETRAGSNSNTANNSVYLGVNGSNNAFRATKDTSGGIRGGPNTIFTNMSNEERADRFNQTSMDDKSDYNTLINRHTGFPVPPTTAIN